MASGFILFLDRAPLGIIFIGLKALSPEAWFEAE
jgi:hypothetical protein